MHDYLLQETCELEKTRGNYNWNKTELCFVFLVLLEILISFLIVLQNENDRHRIFSFYDVFVFMIRKLMYTTSIFMFYKILWLCGVSKKIFQLTIIFHAAFIVSISSYYIWTFLLRVYL